MLAVVIAGLLLGHKAPILQTAQSRIAERMNWRTIAYVLENAVFLLIGLQADWIINDVNESGLTAGRIVGVCAASLAAVVVLRMAWVFPVRYLLVRPARDARTGRTPPWTYTFLIGWAGMRGVVTLAAAFLIPEGTQHREVLFLIAFTVVAGTLFLQGLTLPWVARLLKVPSPDRAEDALARATLLHQASEAGLEVLEAEEDDDPHGVRDSIRTRLEQRNFAAWEQLGDSSAEHETPSQTYSRLRLAMIDAERGKVLEVRKGGQVPHEVVRDVLAMLDIEESMLDHAVETDEGRVGAEKEAGRAVGNTCEDLDNAPDDIEQNTPGECEECVRDGTSLGAPADLPRLWPRRVLRLLTAAARQRTLPRHRAPGHAVRRGRRVLALVLRAPPDRLTSGGRALAIAADERHHLASTLGSRSTLRWPRPSVVIRSACGSPSTSATASAYGVCRSLRSCTTSVGTGSACAAWKRASNSEIGNPTRACASFSNARRVRGPNPR